MRVFFFILLFGAVGTYAQHAANVEIGSVLSFNSRREAITKIIGSYTNDLVALRSGVGLSGSSQNIDGYDNNGFLKYSTPILFDFKGQKFNFESVIGLQNNLLLFASKYDKDNDVNILVASILSPDGKVIRDFQVLDEISASKKRNAGGFNIQITDDSSKVLVYRMEPFDKKGLEKVHFTLLDENLNKLWSKPIELPVRDKDSQLKDYAVDNEGRVFVVSRSKESSSANEPAKYMVYGYLPESDKLIEFELTLPDKFLTDPCILFDRSGELLVSGFYRSDWRKGVNGLFYMRINPKTQEIIARNHKDFSKELLISFLGEKKGEKADKKDKGLYSYVLRNVIRQSNGGIVLVAEQHYWYRVCTTDNRGVQRCNYHYVYGDLLVANINQVGELDWYARVTKFQHTVNDYGYYSSYVLAVHGDKLGFVFNDNPKNLLENSKGRTYEVRAMRKSMVVLSEVDASGKVSKVPLITNKDQQVILRPKVSLQNSMKSVVVLAVRGKKFSFVRIGFND